MKISRNKQHIELEFEPREITQLEKGSGLVYREVLKLLKDINTQREEFDKPQTGPLTPKTAEELNKTDEEKAMKKTFDTIVPNEGRVPQMPQRDNGSP